MFSYRLVPGMAERLLTQISDLIEASSTMFSKETMLVICLFLMCLPVEEVPQPLTSSPVNVFIGTSVTLSSRRTALIRDDDQQPLQVMSATFAQLSEDAWRFDMGGLSRGREGDFWYAVVKEGSAYRFDELGYADDEGAASSLRPPSSGHLLLASGYILDMPLKEFLDLGGLELTADGKPQRPQSEHRVKWKLLPSPDSGVIPAFGTLEWFDENGHSYITAFEYMFGTDLTTATGVESEVDYDTWQNKRLPVEVRRKEGGTLLTCRRTKIESAPEGRSFYGPESFGLERPSRPVPEWLIWTVCLVLLASATLAIRVVLARRRT